MRLLKILYLELESANLLKNYIHQITINGYVSNNIMLLNDLISHSLNKTLTSMFYVVEEYNPDDIFNILTEYTTVKTPSIENYDGIIKTIIEHLTEITEEVSYDLFYELLPGSTYTEVKYVSGITMVEFFDIYPIEPIRRRINDESWNKV